MNYFYLILDIICIGFPIALSFDKNVKFVSKWKYAIVSVLVTSALFIPWDACFTKIAVWGFNDEYLTGIHFFGLPLEENLFFIVVPFACIFVYECVKFYLPRTVAKLDAHLSWMHLLAFNVLSIVLLVIYFGNWYSTSAFLATLIVVNGCSLVVRNYMSAAIISFLFICIPFFFINGALTGLFTENPVVWYNPEEFSQIRVTTIPLEDFFYNILLVASSLFFYLLYQRKILKKQIR